jgi:hypothetical protein
VAADNASPRGQLNGGGMVLPQPNERALLGCLLAKLQVRGTRARFPPDRRPHPCMPNTNLYLPYGPATKPHPTPAPAPPHPTSLSPTLHPFPPLANPNPPHPPPQNVDADVLVGHNISAFDLSVLLHRLQVRTSHLGLPSSQGELWLLYHSVPCHACGRAAQRGRHSTPCVCARLHVNSCPQFHTPPHLSSRPSSARSGPASAACAATRFQSSPVVATSSAAARARGC